MSARLCTLIAFFLIGSAGNCYAGLPANPWAANTQPRNAQKHNISETGTIGYNRNEPSETISQGQDNDIAREAIKAVERIIPHENDKSKASGAYLTGDTPLRTPSLNNFSDFLAALPDTNKQTDRRYIRRDTNKKNSLQLNDFPTAIRTVNEYKKYQNKFRTQYNKMKAQAMPFYNNFRSGLDMVEKNVKTGSQELNKLIK